MFIVGFIIFALYIWGLLTMIYRGHKQQREEFENDLRLRHTSEVWKEKKKKEKVSKVINGKRSLNIL